MTIASRTNPDLALEGADAGVILAAAAHELRLPLSHIKGFVSSLRRTDMTWDRERTSEFLEEIEVETDRLTELIDSLAADGSANAGVARASRAELTHPARIIDSALHRVRCLVADREVQVDVSPGVEAVRVDRNGMERVVANLLQNAIKYSPASSPIRVSARTTDAGDLELAVEDHGPGVAAIDRQRIFQPFFRRQTQAAGNGLGLAIALSIVQAHGGQIDVSDRPGGGARFVVLLPA